MLLLITCCFEKDEIKEIIKIYSKEFKLCENVNFDEIAKLCDNFTGADIKSVVCDAMIKAFHRIYDENDLDCSFSDYFQNNNEKNDDLISNVVISNSDFLSSIKTIQKSINNDERRNLNKLYVLFSINFKKKNLMIV